MPFVMDKFKSKKEASVSKELALFKLSGVNMTYHLFEIKIINIKQVI